MLLNAVHRTQKISNWKKIDKLNGVEKEIKVFLFNFTEWATKGRGQTIQMRIFPTLHNENAEKSGNESTYST